MDSFGDSYERSLEAANRQMFVGAQVVHNPEAPYKRAAFSQYPRPSLAPQNSSELPDLADIKYMCVRSANVHTHSRACCPSHFDH